MSSFVLPSTAKALPSTSTASSCASSHTASRSQMDPHCLYRYAVVVCRRRPQYIKLHTRVDSLCVTGTAQLSAAGDYQEVCSLECDGMWWGHSQHTHRETSAKGAGTCHHTTAPMLCANTVALVVPIAGAGVLVPDTVFVTNLASMVTKTMLLTTFSAVGDVEDVTAHPG